MDLRLTLESISSLALFLSPLPTVIRFYQKKSTQQFHPYNYLAAYIYCIFTVFASPRTNPTWIINLIGFVLNLTYLFSFYIHASPKWKEKLIFAMIVCPIALMTCLLIDPTVDVAKTAAVFRVLLCVVLYGSPLTVVFDVFETKSVEFLPFWIGLAGFVSGCVRTFYALNPLDVVEVVGHGVGAVFSAFQLVLHGFYRRGSGVKKIE